MARTGQEPLRSTSTPSPKSLHVGALSSANPHFPTHAPTLRLSCNAIDSINKSRRPHTNASGADGSNSKGVITDESAKSVAPSKLWVRVRLLKFGIQFSGKKMEASPQGDLSGVALNRALVCGSHGLGMLPHFRAYRSITQGSK